MTNLQYVYTYSHVTIGKMLVPSQTVRFKVFGLQCMCILYSSSLFPPPLLSTSTLALSLSSFPILPFPLHLPYFTLLTPVGVPDAPRITIVGDTLSWEAPNDRGSPITAYRITAM